MLFVYIALLDKQWSSNRKDQYSSSWSHSLSDPSYPMDISERFPFASTSPASTNDFLNWDFVGFVKLINAYSIVLGGLQYRIEHRSGGPATGLHIQLTRWSELDMNENGGCIFYYLLHGQYFQVSIVPMPTVYFYLAFTTKFGAFEFTPTRSAFFHAWWASV